MKVYSNETNCQNWSFHSLYHSYRYVGILRVDGKNFRMDKFRLKTVRPFHTRDVVLSDTDVDPTDDAAVQEYLAEQVCEFYITAQLNNFFSFVAYICVIITTDVKTMDFSTERPLMTKPLWRLYLAQPHSAATHCGQCLERFPFDGLTGHTRI